MSLDAKTLKEELIGAEIVAGKDLTEVAGSAFEAMELGAAIWLQQGRWFLEDYGTFLQASLTRPGDPNGFFSLIESRSEHIATGLHQVGDLVQRECVPAIKIWTDFLSTVRRDWRTP